MPLPFVDQGGYRLPALLCAFALGLFLLAQTAHAQESQPPTDQPHQSRVLAPPDALGTATETSTASCTGHGMTGICHTIALVCPNFAPATAVVKVIAPASTSLGTIVMASGGGDASFYEFAPGYGAYVVSHLLAANFTVAQTEFIGTNGWLQGPAADGPRSLSCNFATLTQWIYTNIHTVGTTLPYCAVGESGGAAAIAYALAHYPTRQMFVMVELGSGPPLSRLDYGCGCAGPAPLSPCGTKNRSCFGQGSTAQRLTDIAYGGNNCQTHNTDTMALWNHDSISSPDAVYSYPTTDVHFLFGSLDVSSAVSQGLLYANQIKTRKSIACVPDAAHDITDVQDGADQIVSDMQTYCKHP